MTLQRGLIETISVGGNQTTRENAMRSINVIPDVFSVKLPLWQIVLSTIVLLFLLQYLRNRWIKRKGKQLKLKNVCYIHPMCFDDTISAKNTETVHKGQAATPAPPIQSLSPYRFPPLDKENVKYALWHLPYKVLFCVNQELHLSLSEILQTTAHATAIVYKQNHRLQHKQIETALWYWQLLGQAKIAVKIPTTENLLILQAALQDAGILTYIIAGKGQKNPLVKEEDINNQKRKRSRVGESSSINYQDDYCTVMKMLVVGPAPSRDIDKFCRHLKLL